MINVRNKKIQVLTLDHLCVILSDVASFSGGIAQLGEHLPYKQRVIGSSPIVPTIFFSKCNGEKKTYIP